MRSRAARLVARLRRHRRPVGVNLVGYLDATSGLGDRVRELAAVLRDAGIRFSTWNVEQTESDRPERDAAHGPDDGVVFDTTIAVVTALAFPGLRWSHRELVDEVERVIGYWFWELEHVPETHRPAIEMVDEIWAPTRFVHDAYAAATDVPVRLVPLPIEQPQPAGLDRPALGLPAEATVFLCSFDQLSSMERKHPLGAIEAFRRAFGAGGEGVHLVVKTINGDVRPDEATRLAVAARGDARIEVRDGYLPAAEHAALVAAADVFVSLHRSEGLGLHVAEAMWLDTAVVATAYSGVLDLVDESCAELVPSELVRVRGGGEAYPDEARWAEPDLDAAAAAMRRLADDPVHRHELARRARSRIEALADRAAAAQRVAEALAVPARRDR